MGGMCHSTFYWLCRYLCVSNCKLRGHFVVVRLMKLLAHQVDFQSPFVGASATDNYIYSSPLAVTFIQLI